MAVYSLKNFTINEPVDKVSILKKGVSTDDNNIFSGDSDSFIPI